MAFTTPRPAKSKLVGYSSASCAKKGAWFPSMAPSNCVAMVPCPLKSNLPTSAGVIVAAPSQPPAPPAASCSISKTFLGLASGAAAVKIGSSKAFGESIEIQVAVFFLAGEGGDWGDVVVVEQEVVTVAAPPTDVDAVEIMLSAAYLDLAECVLVVCCGCVCICVLELKINADKAVFTCLCF